MASRNIKKANDFMLLRSNLTNKSKDGDSNSSFYSEKDHQELHHDELINFLQNYKENLKRLY